MGVRSGSPRRLGQSPELARQPPIPGGNLEEQHQWIGSLHGQIGYAWNASLLYFKGGAAVANARNDLFTTVGGVGIASAERTGWGGTVGVGWEYGFSPNWTAGIEYDYLFRTNNSNTFLTPTLTPVTAVSVNTRSDVNMITARINYRFGGPNIAKY